MNEDSKDERNAYWAGWRARSLAGDLVDTHAFMSRVAHAEAQKLARENQERLPIVVGRLATLALNILNGQQAAEALGDFKSRTPRDVVAGRKVSESSINLVELNLVILASRFPGETSSARMRTAALVNLIAAEAQRGNQATAPRIAKLAGGVQSQVREIARTLEARGVLTARRVPGVDGAASAKVLSIASDAITRLKQAHIEITGSVIKISTE